MSMPGNDVRPAELPFWLRGPFAPIKDEVTARDLPVVGEIPRALRGTYLRNGPNPKEGFSPHWWFGEGMVHGIRLEAGEARWYRNRYVRTDRYEGRTAAPAAEGEDPRAARLRKLRSGGSSNTHVIAHAGRILSLVEAMFPWMLDPELSTLGPFDFDGALDTPMTAHPKVCPKTGELHFFGYQPMPPYLTYYIADAAGQVISKREIEVEDASMMHDFALTERFAVFIDSPVRMVCDWGEGRMPFEWREGRKTRIGLAPRSGGETRWFEVEPCFLSHVANAFERAGTFVLEGARCARFESSPPHHALREIDLASGRAEEREYDERFVDFPRIDERRTGQAHRFTYGVELCDLMSGAPSAVLRRYDAETRESIAQDLGPGRVPGECVFVPKGADPAEDAGWLLSIAFDGAGGSELVILDAEDFGAAPVARVRLPQRVPFGFHGSWVPEAE